MREHTVFAALYDPVMGVVDRLGLAEVRSHVVADATGRVLEVGGGTGLNLRHYRPGGVESVCMLEPDASMRRRLLDRVASMPSDIPVSVVEAPIESSGLPAESFDTIVCALVLCTVDSPDAALAEVRRLLAPGGRLLFLEHVRSPGLRGRVQQATTPAWSRTLGGGCHLDRRTLDSIRQAGFVVDRCDRKGTMVWGVAAPAKAKAKA